MKVSVCCFCCEVMQTLLFLHLPFHLMVWSTKKWRGIHHLETLKNLFAQRESTILFCSSLLNFFLLVSVARPFQSFLLSDLWKLDYLKADLRFSSVLWVLWYSPTALNIIDMLVILRFISSGQIFLLNFRLVNLTTCLTFPCEHLKGIEINHIQNQPLDFFFNKLFCTDLFLFRSSSSC